MLKVTGISKYYDKVVMIYDTQILDNGNFRAYSVNGETEITKDDRDLYYSNLNYLLVNMDKSYESPKAYHEYYTKTAKQLKKETDGKINMFRTGGWTKTSIHLLYSFLNQKNIVPEKIEKYECPFILNCGGPFRLAKKFNGKLHKYDYRSYFPSVYSSEHLMIPIKAGILQTITQKEMEDWTNFKRGIYKCRIEEPKGNLKHLIHISQENLYTHYELTYANSKGLQITMIDEPDNFLHYPADHCLKGSQVFGQYAKYLYELKEKNIEGAKVLLNYIWGALVKGNVRQIVFDERKDDFDKLVNLDKVEVLNTCPIDRNRMRITTVGRERFFDNNLARMKPFLLSKCRLQMSKTIEPYINNVYYSHTDSVLSDIKLPFFDTKTMGGIKYEGQTDANGWIKNANSRIKNDEFHL